MDSATSDDGVYKVAGGEIWVWLDAGGGIFLEARNGSDPVELAEYEAIELAEVLTHLVKEQRDVKKQRE